MPGESEEAFATRCADELEKLILAEGPDTVAAMWAEPIMGAGGVIVPPRDVFREDPGGAAQIRRAVRRRRGDLRLLAHRQLLGQPDARHAARHPDLRQGAVVVLSADQRGDGERPRVPGPGEAEPRDRHVRPRLHLFRPSGAGGGGDRDAEDLRRDEHRRACPRGRRAHAEGTAPPLRRPSAGGRGARRRPDRRDRTGGRQGEAPELRTVRRRSAGA